MKRREYLYDDLTFERIKINSAYKDYSSTWFIRRKLSDNERHLIIEEARIKLKGREGKGREGKGREKRNFR